MTFFTYKPIVLISLYKCPRDNTRDIVLMIPDQFVYTIIINIIYKYYFNNYFIGLGTVYSGQCPVNRICNRI